MKRSLLIASLLAAASLTACSADIASLGGYDHKFKVTLSIGCAASGTLTKTWISAGKVKAEPGGVGWYFMRDDTHKVEHISGTVDIEQLD